MNAKQRQDDAPSSSTDSNGIREGGDRERRVAAEPRETDGKFRGALDPTPRLEQQIRIFHATLSSIADFVYVFDLKAFFLRQPGSAGLVGPQI
jgi:hypothetical protein